MITAKATNKIDALVKDAVGRGAKCCAAAQSRQERIFYPPTVRDRRVRRCRHDA